MKRLVAFALVLIGCGGETEATESTLPPDAGPSTDARDEMQPECELEIAANSTVQGTTPRGPFNARYARLAKAEGECGSSIMVVLSELRNLEFTGSHARVAPPLLIATRRAPRTGLALGPEPEEFTFQGRDLPDLLPTGTLDLTLAEYPT